MDTDHKQIQMLNQYILALQKQIKSNQTERQSLVRQIFKTQQSHQKHDLELRQTKLEMKQLSGIMYRQTIEKTNAENKAEFLTKWNQKLKKENQHKEQTITQLDKNVIEKTDLLAVQKNNSYLKEAAHAKHICTYDQGSKQLEKRIYEVQNQNQAVQLKCAQIGQQLSRGLQQKQRLSLQLSKFKQNNEKVKKAYQKTVQTLKSEHQRESQLNHRQIDRLDKQVASQVEVSTKQIQRNSMLSQQIADLNKQIQRLRQEMHDSIYSKDTTLQTKQKQYEQLLQTYQVSQKSHQEVQLQYQALQRKLQSLEEDMSALRQGLSQSHQKCQELDIINQNSQCQKQKLQENCRQMCGKYQNQKRKNRQMQKNYKLLQQKYQEQMIKLKESQHFYQDALKSNQQIKQKYQELQLKDQGTQLHLIDLQHQYQIWQENHYLLTQSHKELEQRHRGLSLDHQRLNLTYVQSEKSYQDLQQKHNGLQLNHQQLRQNYHSLERNLKGHVEKHKNLEQNLQQSKQNHQMLQKIYEDLTQKHQDLTCNNQQKQYDILKMQQKTQNLIQTYIGLQHQLKLQIYELKQNLQKLEQNYGYLTSENNQMSAKYLQIEERYIQSECKNEQLRLRNHDLQLEHLQIQLNYRSLQAQNQLNKQNHQKAELSCLFVQQSNQQSTKRYLDLQQTYEDLLKMVDKAVEQKGTSQKAMNQSYLFLKTKYQDDMKNKSLQIETISSNLLSKIRQIQQLTIQLEENKGQLQKKTKQSRALVQTQSQMKDSLQVLRRQNKSVRDERQEQNKTLTAKIEKIAVQVAQGKKRQERLSRQLKQADQKLAKTQEQSLILRQSHDKKLVQTSRKLKDSERQLLKTKKQHKQKQQLLISMGSQTQFKTKQYSIRQQQHNKKYAQLEVKYGKLKVKLVQIQKELEAKDRAGIVVVERLNLEHRSLIKKFEAKCQAQLSEVVQKGRQQSAVLETQMQAKNLKLGELQAQLSRLKTTLSIQLTSTQSSLQKKLSMTQRQLEEHRKLTNQSYQKLLASARKDQDLRAQIIQKDITQQLLNSQVQRYKKDNQRLSDQSDALHAQIDALESSTTYLKKQIAATLDQQQKSFEQIRQIKDLNRQLSKLFPSTDNPITLRKKQKNKTTQIMQRATSRFGSQVNMQRPLITSVQEIQNNLEHLVLGSNKKRSFKVVHKVSDMTSTHGGSEMGRQSDEYAISFSKNLILESEIQLSSQMSNQLPTLH